MSGDQVPREGELAAFEVALGELVPARSKLDRDRVMFRSGELARGARTELRARFAWPVAAAVLAIVAGGEATMLATKPPAVVVDRIVYREAPKTGVKTRISPAATQSNDVRILSQTPSPSSGLGNVESRPVIGEYQRLRDQVIRFGLDALPVGPMLAIRSDDDRPRAQSQSSGSLLKSEISKVLNPGDPL